MNLNLNQLLDNKEDLYAEVYFLIKEKMLSGVLFKKVVSLDNFKGLHLLRDDNTMVRVNSFHVLMMELGISVIQEHSFNTRSDLTKLNSPNYTVHSDENVSFEITTTNQNQLFSGNLEDLIKSRKIEKHVNQIQFNHSDFIQIKFTLLKEGKLRKERERLILDSNYVSQLKDFAYRKMVTISEKMPTRTEINQMVQLGFITKDTKAVKKEIKEWLQLYKDKRDLIPYKSVTLLENFRTSSTPNYALILERLQKQ